MKNNRLLWAMPVVLLLPACVARTAVSVVTLPVRAGAKAVDWTTTSQEEADRNRGRAERKQEERDAREHKKEEKRWRQQCRDNGGRDC